MMESWKSSTALHLSIINIQVNSWWVLGVFMAILPLLAILLFGSLLSGCENFCEADESRQFMMDVHAYGSFQRWIDEVLLI